MIYTYLNNSFVEEDKAFLHVSDLSIQRGYGIFDFFRVMDSYPLFIEDYSSFIRSAKEMHLNIHMSRHSSRNI